jgi:hypothetical protein
MRAVFSVNVAKVLLFFFVQSNGPFELLPVVNEFFQISRLPPGNHVARLIKSVAPLRKGVFLC